MLDTLSTTPAVASTDSDFATFGAVHLDVTDGERALGFWRNLVGLHRIDGPGPEIRLGVDGRDLVVLHPGATGPLPRNFSGLYHLALHLPSLAEFARVVARLDAAGYHHYPTDHLMHLADYADDPDGNGLELAFETRQRYGAMEVTANGPRFVDAEGRPHSGRGPIDLDWLFAHVPGGDTRPGLPSGTIMGHVHLRVADLNETIAYYRDMIGFTTNMDGAGFGMSDMSAGGTFPHRLAANTWESGGQPQRPAGTAGLHHLTLDLRSPADLDAAVSRLEGAGLPVARQADGAMAIDPSGNRLLLTTPHSQ